MDYILDEPAPPPRVRTCHGCLEVFRVGEHRRHVRNDCGEMLSREHLSVAIQEAASRGGDSISFVELGKLIERVAVTRMSAIRWSYPEGEDKVVVEGSHRRSIRSCTLLAENRIQRRRRCRAERGVHAITEEFDNMQI